MTEKTITTTEARRNISTIIDEVELGKANYTLTRNDRPVARLVSKDLEDRNRISPKLAAEFEKVLSQYGPALKELVKR